MFIPRRALDANVVGQAAQILRGEAAEGHKAVRKRKPFVTISREFGCQGLKLAAELVEALNGRCKPEEGHEWVWYDKQILDEIAKDQNVKKELVIGAEKNTRGPFHQLLAKMLNDTPDDYDVYQYIVSVISTLVQRGNVVIVGRGGAIITEGLDHGVHVRLYGDMDFKLCHIHDSYPGMPEDREELREIIERENKRRESFVERFTLKTSRTPELYHLMINNGRIRTPEMASMILQIMEHRNLIPLPGN